MTTDLERRLRALRDALPEPPGGIDLTSALAASDGTDVIALDVTAPRRRARWVLAGLVAAALVAGVVVAVEVVRGGSHTDRRDAVGPPALTRIDPATQVVHVGDRVEGDGEIIAVEGKPVVFCALEASGLVASPDPFTDCRDRVDVTGVDLAVLAMRQEHPANAVSAAWVTGYAHLAGTYGGDRLTDVVQTPYVQSPPTLIPDDPPCPAPAGGWPEGPADANIDMTPLSDYQTRHPGEVVSIATLRPSSTQAVAFALTSGDPAALIAAVRPAYGAALCVVQSRYSQAELTAAEKVTSTSGPLWKNAGVWYSDGPGGIGPDAQPLFSVGLPIVTDAVVAAVRDLAPGLVQFAPWLTPVRG